MDLHHEERLTKVEDRSKSNSHRLDEIERRQNNLDELVGTVKVLADREERVEDDVREIKNDVKTLTNKPAERWNKLFEIALTAAVGIVIGFIFSKLGF